MKTKLLCAMVLVWGNGAFAMDAAPTVVTSAEQDAIQSAFVQDAGALNIKALAATEMQTAKAGPKSCWLNSGGKIICMSW